MTSTTSVPVRRDVAGDGRSTDPHHDASTPFGQFRWDIRTASWAWSSGMFAVHGYPGPVVRPTTTMVLDHKESSDRPRAAAILDRARSTTSSYVNHHRIVDANGRTRTVVTVGSSALVGDGGLVSSGFVVDLTDVERLAGTAAVNAAAEGRTAINQAQGAVMAATGLEPDQALALLVRYSQAHHRKLNALCTALVAGLAKHGPVSDTVQLTFLLDRAATSSRAGGSRRAKPEA